MVKGTDVLKEGFAKMTKGGVIMDVINAEQAGITEDAEAVAVSAEIGRASCRERV